MTFYRCAHHDRQEHTYSDTAHLYCGHDGTVHLACHREPAPADSKAPDGWPIYLSWRTLCADVGQPAGESPIPCDEEREPGSDFCALHRERSRLPDGSATATDRR